MKSKHKKIWFFYGVMLAVSTALIYVLVILGKSQETDLADILNHGSGNFSKAPDFSMYIDSLWLNIGKPGALLLLQMISILFFARIFGDLFRRIGQPTVIGEILAGIILGPSILGKFCPDIFHFLFAPDSLANIYYLSQVGLILFMFIIGMELNLSTLKNKLGETLVISHAGILFPFFLGMLLAYFVYTEFAAGETAYLPFALFIGIAMSITAFPVLARIIQEKDLARTPLGTMTLGCAAIDDVTAWCILAAVIAITKTGSMANSLFTILLTVIYALMMLFVVRPFLKKIGTIYQSSELVNKSTVAFIFLVLLISAYTTEAIGIHALFGAFMAGVVMPPLTNFRRIIAEKMEDVSVSFLLPLFFVFTGLRTEIGLLNTPHLWLICGVIVLVAIIGKFGGISITARIMGVNTRDSLSMGVLMNTRGLMELIVLNIGYEMGVLPPPLFVMLVIMALLTTFITTPLLNLIERLLPIRNKHQELLDRQKMGLFKALVAVGNPANGKILLTVAKSVLDGSKNNLAVNVLHITEGTDVNMLAGEQYLEDSFKGVRAEAEQLGIPIETEYKITDNVSHEIVHTTNEDQYDFLLVGGGIMMAAQKGRKKASFIEKVPFLKVIYNSLHQQQVFYPSTLIKDKTRYFIENCFCSVGVFVNRNFLHIKKTLIILKQEEDAFLLRYARRLLRNNPAVIIRIKDLAGLSDSNKEVAQGILKLMKEFPDAVQLCKPSMNDQPYMSGFSFMLISYQAWNQLVASEQNELEFIPSTLIINKKRSRFHEQTEENGNGEE